MAGDPDAPRVIFLIPQHHRDATSPVSWTTLGGEIAEIQQQLDTLTRHLAQSHGVTCIGSEGSVLQTIKASSELRQLAEWKVALSRSRRALLEQLGLDAEVAREPADTVVRVLTDAIRIHAAYQDGVGAAQARLAGSVTLTRFGLEDAQANNKALALLEELRSIERQLAHLEPESDPVEVDILGRMWLEEYPAYEARTLKPLAVALEQLDHLRLELFSDGLHDLSRAVGGFVARARRIAGATIQPDDVEATIAYYRDVERRARQNEKTGRTLSRSERRRRARLLARQTDVTTRFDAVAMGHREAVAVRRVLDRMRSEGFLRCALVMGANHQDGLVRRLLAEANTRKLGPLGIVVVAPFYFGD